MKYCRHKDKRWIRSKSKINGKFHYDPYTDLRWERIYNERAPYVSCLCQKCAEERIVLDSLLEKACPACVTAFREER